MAPVISAVIPEKLYISNLELLNDEATLERLKIKTILSVGFDLEFKPPFIYKTYKDILDDAGVIVIHLFPEVINFIETGVQNGATLVHCYAGMSRSATFVIAYLMKSQKLSAEDALKRLKEVHPIASPNRGFWKQLQLFEEMNYTLDPNNQTYRRMTFSRHRVEEPIDSLLFTPDPILASTANGCIRCRACRRVIGLPEHLIAHTPGSGYDTNSWNIGESQTSKDISSLFKEPKSQKQTSKDCSSLFIEPMAWMKLEDTKEVQGKIKCIKCDAKLGIFNWSGSQCSCGAWISPSFMLHKKSVDTVFLETKTKI